MSKVAIRPGTPHKGKQLVLGPILCREFSHDLLRKHVERSFGDEELIELTPMDGIDEARAFDKIVTGKRKQPALWGSPHRMTRAPDPL